MQLESSPIYYLHSSSSSTRFITEHMSWLELIIYPAPCLLLANGKLCLCYVYVHVLSILDLTNVMWKVFPWCNVSGVTRRHKWALRHDAKVRPVQQKMQWKASLLSTHFPMRCHALWIWNKLELEMIVALYSRDQMVKVAWSIMDSSLSTAKAISCNSSYLHLYIRIHAFVCVFKELLLRLWRVKSSEHRSWDD